MSEILLSVIENLLWAIIGFVLVLLQKFILTILPTRKLWSIKDIDNLSIIAATSTQIDTGQYIRKATGVGQLRGLAILINSLNLAYKNMNINDILLSTDHVGQRLEEDLILLGGPKNNHLTRKVMDKLLESHKVINQEKDVISWYVKDNGEDAPTPQTYQSETENKKVTVDYGVIISVENPYSSNHHRLCIFSGGHTHGTIAAATYFTKSIKKYFFQKKLAKNFIMVVKCDVINDEPCNIRLVQRWESNHYIED